MKVSASSSLKVKLPRRNSSSTLTIFCLRVRLLIYSKLKILMALLTKLEDRARVKVLVILLKLAGNSLLTE